MTKGGSQKMKIKIKTVNGELDSVTDGSNVDAGEMTQAEVDQMYASPDGPRYVGTILYTHSSPGCVVYYYRGKYRKVCY